MIDGKFVFNAVSHAYNLSDENTQDNKDAPAVRDTLVSLQRDMQQRRRRPANDQG